LNKTIDIGKKIETPLRHSQDAPLYAASEHFAPPYPFSITSRRRELNENGQYISCASLEARMTKIIV